jgi:hypothetical protein
VTRRVNKDDLPPEVAGAVELYQTFHRFEPRKIGAFSSGFQIPLVMYKGGAAVWVAYQSGKVDPATLRKPSKPVNYIHEHDAGVGCYLASQRDAGGVPGTEVPARFRNIEALTRLGHCLGFCYKDAGEEFEVKGVKPYPDLYATPDGRCLLVIEKQRRVLAMMWGGGLGVFARGIDG